MTVRNGSLSWIALAAALAHSACGTAPSDAREQAGAALSYPVPVALRLTTIKMNGNSTNPAQAVHVYVKLPGLSTTSTYLGDYAPKPSGNPNFQFNCSSVHALPGPDGYCTTNLPLYSTVGPVKFIGKYPAGTNSAAASVQVNNTVTNFTIDSTGHPSQTCASAWMMLNNSIDGDKITVCWQVTLAIPFTSPPLLETVFYLAPGEGSSVGLSQSNSISTRTAYSYTNGSGFSFNINFDIVGVKVGEGLSFQESTTVTSGQTTTSGSSTGYTVASTSMLSDPNNNEYHFVVGANASWLKVNDGSPPSISVDLPSGLSEKLTLGQLKGLAQTPQDVSTIPFGDQGPITKSITPSVARQFLAQDPFLWNEPISKAVTDHPERFTPADPPQMTLQRRSCSTCGDPSTTQSQVHGSGTDTTVGQNTGSNFSFSVMGLGLMGTDAQSISTTYSDTNQSTATITLRTHSLCVEGAVDLYMDKSFGTIVPVPHLEDSCNSPTNCPGGQQRVLLSGQSLGRGQSLTSCNGLWSLTLQSDGMLVEHYVPDGSTATSFWTPGATAAVMQSNGDFAVYDGNGNLLTDSGTSSGNGAYLILQDDGFIDIYDPLGNPGGGVGGALPALWAMAPGG